MTERLLTVDEAATKLGISRRTFYRLRTQLVAKGLQERVIGERRLYRESSLDQLIAADDEASVVLARTEGVSNE